MAATPPHNRLRRVPSSSYRLQFHRGFTFSDAQAIVAYLHDLGVTDVYASPYLRANPGSTHGYDICDHNQLNPELGSPEDYERFVAALATHGMGQILDFVPNHMAASAATNPWWRDVLENGRCSRFARFFDIDWEPVKVELHQKILLPIADDHYGLVLERGEVHLALADGGFALRYFDHDLPINPRPAAEVLRGRMDELRARLADEDAGLREYLSIVTALDHLPPYTETEPDSIEERQREKQIAYDRLHRLLDAAPIIRAHVDENIRIWNGTPGRRDSFDALHLLLEAQPYRLAYWRTASHEINYRRFFDINTLAGLRMEDPAVFDATHELVLRLVAERKVTGLRFDHIDGLFDPAEYLRRVQRAAAAVAGVLPDNGDTSPLYTVVEKILSPGETLPRDWCVDGTSGYDFLNDVNRVFVATANARALRGVYRRFSRHAERVDDVTYQSKKLMMRRAMASELNVLANALNRLSEADRRTRDFTLNSLREVLEETVASFPVYRTYVGPDGASDADRGVIDDALRRTRRRNPTMERSILSFVRSVLLPTEETAGSRQHYEARLRLAMKFQQYTGPVQAKGLEDTAFYRHPVLLSLNEVGGDPERFGMSLRDFHAANAHRQAHWPHTLLATATHDTKRGEDARARLNVLSEIPDQWRTHVFRWGRINSAHRTLIDDGPAPDRNDEYVFYQTLVGVWPAVDPAVTPPAASVLPDLIPRLREYMIKAVREAKLHTSWINHNEAYEAAVIRFVEQSLTGRSAARFFASFLPFQHDVARLGMLNSLSQLTVKLTSPGIPDFYQGTELWDLSLVDPDNRRPVDYAVRRELLAALLPLLNAYTPDVSAIQQLLAQWHDGRIKLFLTAAGLRLRQAYRHLFLQGCYTPLDVEGRHAENVLAYARVHDGACVLTIVPRLPTQLIGTAPQLPLGAAVWEDTRVRLPPSATAPSWRNRFTGESVATESDGAIRVAQALATLPDALLVAVRR